VNWWNDIKFLAHGEFIYKDNADIVTTVTIQTNAHKLHRDLENVGDYFLLRHRKAIEEAGMKGVALCGEMAD
jgi:hypothetical protein